MSFFWYRSLDSSVCLYVKAHTHTHITYTQFNQFGLGDIFSLMVFLMYLHIEAIRTLEQSNLGVLLLPCAYVYVHKKHIAP